METLSTTTTFIKDKYHIRLLDEGKVIDEMVCNEKIDIGYCIKQMLRWYDKLGGTSKMASSSRGRHKHEDLWSYGKVWTKTQWEARSKTSN